MRIVQLGVVVFLLLLLLGPAPAGAEPEAAGKIAWSKDLPTALAQAKKAERVLMVCINARKVDGRTTLEPAAKGLRDVVYKHARIVEKSREFVCVLLTKEGDAAEYDALRKLGIDGNIISPQHIFISPPGDRILTRREYWSDGNGDRAVRVLMGMMDKALAAWKAIVDAPPVPDGGPAAPPSNDGRAAWIAEKMKQVGADADSRDRALRQLVEADEDGDCTAPLIALLAESGKDTSMLWALIRALGQDGLEAAALPIAEHLKHKDDTVRANAAVSLEYIGSRDKKVISALKKRATKEKDEGIANHAYRALGRCGSKDAKIRSLLLDKAAKSKSEFASYGPCIGLAYFEDDTKAARGVEKLLKQLGVPGGKRGGGQNTIKRGLVSWTLASIGDAKSAEFVREELISGLDNVKAFWVAGMVTFWEGVANACDGEAGALQGVEAGVRRFVEFTKGMGGGRRGGSNANYRSLMDGARRDRTSGTDFKPKGDDLLDSGDM